MSSAKYLPRPKSDTESVFYCPSNEPLCQHTDNSQWDPTLKITSWYYINGQDEKYCLKTLAPGLGTWDTSAGMTPTYRAQVTNGTNVLPDGMRSYLPKVSSIHQPAVRVLLYEGTTYNVRNESPAQPLSNLRWLPVHNSRHSTNLVFCDGHAASVEYRLSGPGNSGTPTGYPGTLSSGVDWFIDK